MQAWKRPNIPKVPGLSAAPKIFDSASQQFVDARPGDVAGLYVCGITPYDATHLGHASTYLAFDTLHRVWLDAGFEVHYTQNITDVDDPLLERAVLTGVNWRTLADEQIELFRTDMAALRIIPPHDYIAVTEIVDEIAVAIDELLGRNIAYRVTTPKAPKTISTSTIALPKKSVHGDLRRKQLRPRDDAHRLRPAWRRDPTARESGMRSTLCSGVLNATANQSWHRRSVLAARAGTLSVPSSR